MSYQRVDPCRLAAPKSPKFWVSRKSHVRVLAFSCKQHDQDSALPLRTVQGTWKEICRQPTQLVLHKRPNTYNHRPDESPFECDFQTSASSRFWFNRCQYDTASHYHTLVLSCTVLFTFILLWYSFYDTCMLYYQLANLLVDNKMAGGLPKKAVPHNCIYSTLQYRL